MVLSRKRWCLAAFGVVGELPLLLFCCRTAQLRRRSQGNGGPALRGGTRRHGAEMARLRREAHQYVQ